MSTLRRLARGSLGRFRAEAAAAKLLGPRERSEVDKDEQTSGFIWPAAFWRAQIRYVEALPPEDRRAIQRYAAEEHYAMNYRLRKAEWRPQFEDVEHVTKQGRKKVKRLERRLWLQEVDRLQRIIVQAPPSPGRALLFRGMRLKKGRNALRSALSQLQVGRVYEVSGFQSWTYDPNVASNWAAVDDLNKDERGEEDGEEGVVMVLRVNAGMPMLWANAEKAIQMRNQERELILPHGSSLRFVGRSDSVGKFVPSAKQVVMLFDYVPLPAGFGESATYFRTQAWTTLERRRIAKLHRVNENASSARARPFRPIKPSSAPHRAKSKTKSKSSSPKLKKKHAPISPPRHKPKLNPAKRPASLGAQRTSSRKLNESNKPTNCGTSIPRLQTLTHG
jgi:hypothetical protein